MVLPLAVPPVLQTEPQWHELPMSHVSEQPDADGQVDSVTSPPSQPPSRSDTHIRPPSIMPPEGDPLPLPTSGPGTPVPTILFMPLNCSTPSLPVPKPGIPDPAPAPLAMPSDRDLPPVMNHVSSLDHLASAYSSGRQSPEPNSIFEPHLKDSTSPSSASTVSAEFNEYKTPEFTLSPVREDVVPSYVPKPLIIRPGTLPDPTRTALGRSYTPLSEEVMQKMRARLSVISVTSSDADPYTLLTRERIRKMRARLSFISGSSLDAEENDPPSTPVTVAVEDFDKPVSHKLPSAIPKDTIDVFQSTEHLVDGHPPPIPPRSAQRNPIVEAPTTDIVSNPVPPSSRDTTRPPHLPLAPPYIRTTLPPPLPKPKPPPRTTAVELPRTWLDKAPHRHDSVVGPSLAPVSRRYTRPKKTWYAVRERFLEIFGDAPTIAASARRENPKIYQMRKRRTLVEMGLTEMDLNERTDSRRGEKIMRLLDGLEERLMREREEEAKKGYVGEGSREKVRSSVARVSTIGVHCANDVRSGFIDKSGKGKGKVVGRRG